MLCFPSRRDGVVAGNVLDKAGEKEDTGRHEIGTPEYTGGGIGRWCILQTVLIVISMHAGYGRSFS